ncbi:bile acid:sodium symporter family protein [Thalassococcus sp. S3]|uniref:bile acid:sodium symporter family protein n=1 Tax=Thalassococcus sp. S3 TaxID=2017482 RepID=UPI0010241285|nr:bile acid:sodium symporter family protein [Thalassococcus sp. S3]QBF31123.1 bile acid:sodium symporter [Thalassococcus sp. S3]
MDILINVFLPLSLAIIMFSLGVGLEAADFKRVAQRGHAFLIGAISQVLLLPMTAFVITLIFDLPPEIAVGIMILSFCPGGVTSNILSKLSKGDVALSVSLTAVISLLSILTVPFLVAWSVGYFMGDAAPEVSIASLAFALFLITTLPVVIGVALRHFATGFALAIDLPLSRLAVALFVIIVLAALATNWDTFVENVAVIGGALIALNAALLVIGLVLAKLGRLTWPEMKTISLETGVQNSTLGIALAALVTGVTDGFSTMALPSAVYGITMYLVALPFIAWFRSR